MCFHVCVCVCVLHLHVHVHTCEYSILLRLAESVTKDTILSCVSVIASENLDATLF